MSEPIPSYQAIDFLRRASEEAEDAPEGTVEEIFHKVIDEGAGAGQVAREYGAVLFPVDPDVKKQRDIAAVRNVAKRLHEILGETKVIAKPLAADGREVLARILEALEPKQQEAA